MTVGDDSRDGLDFLVSYAHADRAWAEWIARILAEDGYQVLIQAWDYRPGNWSQSMQAGLRDAARIVAVLSPDYLEWVYGSAELQTAEASDPAAIGRKLLVVRVAACDRPELLAGIASVDVFGITEAGAKARLRRMISLALAGRAEPDAAPGIPAAGRPMPREPWFPDQKRQPPGNERQPPGNERQPPGNERQPPGNERRIAPPQRRWWENAPAGRPAPALPPSQAVGYDDLVRKTFAELVQPGHLLFNPPDRMQLGHTERVEVRLARTLKLDTELLEGLRGHGEPQVEEIPTAPLMAVTLMSDGFRINSYSDEEQSVTPNGITTWEFDICALQRGRQRLIMCVSLRIPVPGQPLEHRSIPVREAAIEVEVGAPALVAQFVSRNWQWFIGTAIAIAAVITAVLYH